MTDQTVRHRRSGGIRGRPETIPYIGDPQGGSVLPIALTGGRMMRVCRFRRVERQREREALERVLAEPPSQHV